MPIHIGDGVTDRHEILHVGTYRSQIRLLPFRGGSPKPRDPKSEILGLNFGHLSLITNISKTVSCSVTRPLELNISWITTF